MQASDRELQTIDDNIEKTKRKIEAKKVDYQKYSQRAADFELNRTVRQQEMMSKARSVQDTIDNLILPDVDELTAKWGVIQKIQAGIDKLKSKKNDLYLSIQSTKSAISDKERFIQKWKECIVTGKQIGRAHV